MKLKFKVEKRRLEGKSVKLFAFRIVLVLLARGMFATGVQAQSSDEEGLVAEWHFEGKGE
jgi:hypothetical protein